MNQDGHLPYLRCNLVITGGLLIISLLIIPHIQQSFADGFGGFNIIPNTEPTSIPSWIKNNAGWWSKGAISDDEFVRGIQYLISVGIIKI